jgi:hypothetical protein
VKLATAVDVESSAKHHPPFVQRLDLEIRSDCIFAEQARHHTNRHALLLLGLKFKSTRANVRQPMGATLNANHHRLKSRSIHQCTARKQESNSQCRRSIERPLCFQHCICYSSSACSMYRCLMSFHCRCAHCQQSVYASLESRSRTPLLMVFHIFSDPESKALR